MKLYEFAYLVSPELSPEAVKDFQKKITGFLQKENGIIQKSDSPEKIVLGYEIKDKKEAHLISLDFKMMPENLSNFKKDIESEPLVLRHIILNKKERKENISTFKKEKKEDEKKKTEKKEKEEKKDETKKKKIERKKKSLKEEKVEISELDKKLEEMLG